jgi:hypothetical protein
MLNTVESLRRRTGPAVVKWFTASEQQRQFDTIPEALNFAQQFGDQRSALHIEFATGAVMFRPEIDSADLCE